MPKVNLAATLSIRENRYHDAKITIRLTSWKDSYFFNLKIKIMTLKEKFNNELAYDANSIITDNLEQIADDFAIGFAEWFELNSIYNGSEFLIYIEDNKQYTIKQFLEIYKKEKGL